MRNATPWMLAVVVALLPARAFAQGETPTKSVEVMNPAIQEAVQKALQALKPGVTVNDRIISLQDEGGYNVAVAVVARPAGTFQNSLSHDTITEIYYVLRGTGTQVTGTMAGGTRGATVSRTIGPSMSSNSPIQNAKSTKLGPATSRSSRRASRTGLRPSTLEGSSISCSASTRIICWRCRNRRAPPPPHLLLERELHRPKLSPKGIQDQPEAFQRRRAEERASPGSPTMTMESRRRPSYSKVAVARRRRMTSPLASTNSRMECGLMPSFCRTRRGISEYTAPESTRQ